MSTNTYISWRTSVWVLLLLFWGFLVNIVQVVVSVWIRALFWKLKKKKGTGCWGWEAPKLQWEKICLYQVAHAEKGHENRHVLILIGSCWNTHYLFSDALSGIPSCWNRNKKALSHDMIFQDLVWFWLHNEGCWSNW